LVTLGEGREWSPLTKREHRGVYMTLELPSGGHGDRDQVQGVGGVIDPSEPVEPGSSGHAAGLSRQEG
jgi:hypothetical protein